MRRSIKKITQAEAAEAAAALRHAVARAQTKEDFGKAFKAFREAITGRGVRYLADLIFMSKTSLNNQENGMYPFEEEQLRDAMRVLEADENTTAACLEHWRRTKDVAPVAQPPVCEPPQDTNIETDQQCCETKVGQDLTSGAAAPTLHQSTDDPLEPRVPATGEESIDFDLLMKEWKELDAVIKRRSLRDIVSLPMVEIAIFGLLICAVIFLLPYFAHSFDPVDPIFPRGRVISLDSDDYVGQRKWCMAVEGASIQDNAAVRMATCGAPAQDWHLRDSIDGYTLTNVNSGKCLGRTNGNQIVQQTCSDFAPGQTWQLALLGFRDPGNGRTRVTVANDKDGKQGCLTMNFQRLELTLSLSLAPCAGSGDQKFWITPLS